ncbi:MAG: hypothetical protein WBA74_06310, partial [Cyclobacteriaceae bacterium]
STELSVDDNKKLVIVKFIGDIRFDDYKEVLLAAADQVATRGIENIILDRTQIEKLDAECRVWVKNEYLRVHIKPLIPSLDKVAVVDAKSIVGQLYGKAIYNSLSWIYPSLSFRFFSKVEKAMAWLEPEMKVSYSASQQRDVIKEPMVVGYRASQNKKPKMRTASDNRGMQMHHDDISLNRKKDHTGLFEKLFNKIFPRFS